MHVIVLYVNVECSYLVIMRLEKAWRFVEIAI